MRKFIRSLQEVLERTPVGSGLQELLWSTRHLYKHNWASNFLKTINHAHRTQIVDSMLSFNIENPTILEAGSGPGANFIPLRRAFPRAQLIGVDINNQAVKEGRKYFSFQADAKVSFFHGNLSKLSFIESQSIDLILVDAVLMFITPDKIQTVLNELIRCLKPVGSGMVINDFHADGLSLDGLFVGGRWVHDLVSIINMMAPQSIISVKKSSFTGGEWDRFGSLIEVRF